MLKKLTRKFVILSVLVVALTAVFAAPALAQDDIRCFFCWCDSNGCQCVEIMCPQ